MTEELGVCIVGCGEMGRLHAAGWRSVPGARILAVADPDEARARALASEFGVQQCHAEYLPAIEARGVRAVSVCTPAAFHPEVTVAAAERGMHVLCEKPIALSLAEADRMIDVARGRRVLLGMGFQRRLGAPAREIGRIIGGSGASGADGTSGAPRGNALLGRPLLWRKSMAAPIRTVRGKPAMHDALKGNGGPVVDMCCHAFDLWHVLFAAEAVRVTARGFTFARGRPELAGVARLAPDTATIMVEHSTGDLGVYSITWGLPPGVEGVNAEDILGPRGAVVFDGTALLLRREGREETRIECAEGGEKTLEVQRFAQAVREGGVPAATGADGRRALEVSLAALRSMAAGITVELAAGG